MENYPTDARTGCVPKSHDFHTPSSGGGGVDETPDNYLRVGLGRSGFQTDTLTALHWSWVWSEPCEFDV